VKSPERTDEILVEEGTDRTGLIVLLGLVVLLGVWGGVSALAIVGGLVVMIFLHELGHYLTAKWAGMEVTEFFLGFGPRIWSFQRGETEYGVKAVPAGAYVRIIGMSNLDDVDPADEDRTYRAKPFWRRLSVALAGSTMHFLQAFVIMLILLLAVGVAQADRWTVASPQGPAADGEPVEEFDDLSSIVSSRGGETVDVVFVRDGEQQTVEVTLADEHPETGEQRGFLGVGREFDKVRRSPIAAIPDAAGEVVSGIGMSITGLADLFSPSGITQYVDQVSGRVEDGDNEGRVTSVVGVVKEGSKAADQDWAYLLYILFTVNVFVGVFNLTPLLPFDGGHAVIAIYEKIRSMIAGREYRADVAKLMPLTYVVILVLGLLMVTSVYMDLARPLEL
jgi:membrane-associated protease RseP (regulator of RpoE activity)